MTLGNGSKFKVMESFTRPLGLYYCNIKTPATQHKVNKQNIHPINKYFYLSMNPFFKQANIYLTQ